MEVLAFLKGDVAVDPLWQPGHGHRLPPYARTDLALRGAAELIRKLHSAAGFRPAITSYRCDPRPPRPGEVVSHGDLGPWNTVYRDGIPVAFIDWDSAGPVDPLADLAAAAWTFVELRAPAQAAAAAGEPVIIFGTYLAPAAAHPRPAPRATAGATITPRPRTRWSRTISGGGAGAGC
jgi:Phosphotransferase enzyme family